MPSRLLLIQMIAMVTAAAALAVMGVRDSLLLLGSARPALRMRLLLWTMFSLAIALPAGFGLLNGGLAPFAWMIACCGHLLRWAVARWFDLRPSRNGLVWLSAVVPAPSLAIALSVVGLGGGGSMLWCAAVSVSVLALARFEHEPRADDIARFSQSLDLAAASIAALAAASL